MYWDDKYGTETVSQDVLARMKSIMAGSGPSTASFLLDFNNLLNSSWDDLQGEAEGALFLPLHLPDAALVAAAHLRFLKQPLVVQGTSEPPAVHHHPAAGSPLKAPPSPIKE